METEFSNLNGKSSWKIRVTTSREEGNIVTDDGRLVEFLGKICFQFQSPRIDENDRGGKQKRRWITGGSGDFLEAGRSGSLVPMGKMVPRLLRLLHTLIYFKRGEGGGTSFPSAADESLSRISSMGIDARDTVEGLFYLSLNGNRIPTCYFLWEDFFGRWSCRIRERLGDCVWKDPRVPAV